MSKQRSWLNATAAIILAGFVLAMSLPTVFVYWPFPEHGSFGFGADSDGIVQGVYGAADAKLDGTAEGDASRAVIVEGDRIDYGSMPPDQRYGRGIDREPWPGTTATFRVVHRGTARDVRLTARVHAGDRISAFQALTLFLKKLSVAVFVLIAVAIVIARPSVLTWSFFLYALGAQFHTIPRFWAFLPELWYVTLLFLASDVLVGTALVGFLVFALRFPAGVPIGWRKPCERLVMVAAVPVVLTMVAGDFAPTFGPDGCGWVYIWFAEVGCIYALGLTALWTTFSATRGSERRRVEWVILALTFSFGISLLGMVDKGFAGPGWIWEAGDLLFALDVVAALALGYAIHRYRVIDVRFVLNRAATYAVATTALAVVLVLAYRLVDAWVQRTGLALAVQIVIAIGIGVAMQRSYRKLDDVVGRVLFRSVHEAQQRLTALSEALPHAGSVSELEALLVNEPLEALSLSSAAIFRPTSGGRYAAVYAAGDANQSFARIERSDPVVRYLESRKQSLALASASPGSADPSLAVPIWVANQLEAIVLYGPHRNGTAVDPDERAALQRVGEAASNAFAVHRQRFQDVRALSQLLAASDTDARELHAYLAEELLDRMPPEQRSQLLACASLGEATAAEIAVATGDPDAVRSLAEIAARTPLIGITERGAYIAHPVIAIVANRVPALRDQFVRRVAEAASANGDHDDAARRYASIGAHAEAASEIDAAVHERVERGSALLDNDELILAIPISSDEAATRPALWAARLPARLAREPLGALRAELAVVRARIPPGARALQRWFAIWDAYLGVQSGAVTEAEAPLEAMPSGDAPIDRFARCVRALVDGRAGRIFAARSAAIVELQHPLGLLVLATCVERPTGSFDAERVALDAAVGADALAAEIAAERLAAAWIAGDGERLAAALVALRKECDDQAVPYRNLVASAAGLAPGPDAGETWRWLTYGELIGISAGAPGPPASVRAARAVAFADRAGAVFERVLARVVLGQVNESERESALAEARTIAYAVDAPPLHAAVDATIAENPDSGMLRAVVESVRNADARIHVELLRGIVRRRGAPIALSEKELALVATLAAQGTPVSTLELVDRLWPDQDEETGTKALQVTIHRVRRRLDDAGAIVTTPTGYGLRDDVSTDLTQLETMLRSLATRDALDDFTRLRLQAVSNRMQRVTLEYADYWEWFAPVRERIAECGRNADLRLAHDALSRKDFSEARRFADRLIARDAFDEPAREVSLRSRLGSGDRSGAMREYRRYRDQLAAELAAEPTAALVELMRVAPVRGTDDPPSP